MRQFIEHLTERNFQNKKVAFIENGSWAPVATKIMKGMFEKSKGLDFAINEVTIKSAVTDENLAQLEALADELAQTGDFAEGAVKMKCGVCGFVFDPEKEGKSFDEVGNSYKCPICGMGKQVFAEEAAAKKAPAGDKYSCGVCGYAYDEEEEGKPFEDQPDTYKCPLCGMAKAVFKKD